jgi:diguanylate cyclase (GGDEF)-like protein/PAS domain S-box-containing protein
MEFGTRLGIIEFLIPAVCSGILFIEIMLFLYIYTRSRNKLYLSMTLLSFFAFIFVVGEALILTTGGWLHDARLAVQFHRIEQVGGAFFIFGLPYFLLHFLQLNNRFQKINKAITLVGFAVSIVISITAFVFPDLFISLRIPQSHWFRNEGSYGRGQEGLLYNIRDIILGLLIVYSMIIITIDILWHKKKRYLLLPLIGMIYALYSAIDDIIGVYMNIHIGLMPDMYYSRFSLGVTVFMVVSMFSLIKIFIDKSEFYEKTHNELIESEERFRQLADNINQVFWITNKNKIDIHYISPAVEKVWGIPPKKLYTDPLLWLDSVNEDDYESVKDSIQQEANGDLEYKINHGENGFKWVRDRFFPIKDEDGFIYRWARISEDVTEYKKAETELLYLAYHDNLTGLYNRKSFYEKLNESIVQAERSKTEKIRILFFIDLDRFKEVNDTLGHDIGDKLLVEISKRFEKCLRKTDYIFRLGGDEFTILLNRVSNEFDSNIVAQKIIDTVVKPYYIENHEIFIGLSIGISSYPKDGLTPDILIKNADFALFEAKKEKNKYVFYDKSFNNLSMKKMKVENCLRKAVGRNELNLFYQPIVNMNREIIGAEALLRWNCEDLGRTIPPGEFIPIAEDSGLIIQIGDWVLANAHEQLKKWEKSDNGKIKMSVNVSIRQFKQKNFIEKIERIFREAGFDDGSLEFEITESCMMEDPDDAIAKMKILNARGISFSIDDFGTGYSSLAYIKKLPIAKIKIDRSFIQDLMIAKDNKEITKAIVDMSHNLDKIVLAEGVENSDQMDFLASLGCDEMQGFYFSKAVPSDEFDRLLARKTLP